MSTREIEKLLEFASAPPVIHPGLAAGYLPSFESVVAVTSNAVAAMTTVAAYESARLSQTFNPHQHGLNVHFDQDRLTQATIAYPQPGTGMPPSIQFRDTGGVVGHTAHITSAADIWALESLALSGSIAPHATAPGTGNDVSPVDDTACLEDCHENLVDPQAIPLVFKDLITRSIPILLVLGNDGCIQCDDGTLQSTTRHGGSVFIKTSRTTLSYDPLLIAKWYKRASASDSSHIKLEAICAQGIQRFSITCSRRGSERSREDWHKIMEALPSIGTTGS